jgi:hypothetical protein
MKIKLIHRRPCSPMRMRDLLCAFKKIPAPYLAGDVSQFSRKRLKQAKRYIELQCPNRRLRNLFLDYTWERSPNLNLSAHFPRKFRKRLETVCSPLRIDYVRTEKSPTAIEFKIEITPIRLRLHEKFDTTVFPHLVEILLSNTPDVPIMH